MTPESELDFLNIKLKYFHDQIKEIESVIQQLISGPGEIIYIHPADWTELVHKTAGEDWPMCCQPYNLDNNVIGPRGQKYYITPYAPAKSTRFK